MDFSNIDEEMYEDLIEFLKANPDVGRVKLAEKFDLTGWAARKILAHKDELLSTPYATLLKHSADLYKQKQKMQDVNRIERKIRNQIREENASAEYMTELVNAIKLYHPQKTIIVHDATNSPAVGVFCLSDLHLNELVELPNNTYSFDVAAKRLKKFVSEARRYFLLNDIKNVVICGLGDFMNSSRRIDELLNRATNLSKATYLAVLLLEQVIVDLNQDFNLSFAMVSGNESRLDDNYGHSEMMMTHNYDWNIKEMLKIVFRNSSINFIDGPSDELVININGNNFLLMHGNQINSNVCKSIQQIKGKYADQGIMIDYVIFGHIHESMICDLYARSSSLVGANAYSDRGLQLSSRASQMIGIVRKGGIDMMKIDLQNVDDVEGYDINDKLCEYNAKSAQKVKEIKSQRFYVVAEIN